MARTITTPFPSAKRTCNPPEYGVEHTCQFQANASPLLVSGLQVRGAFCLVGAKCNTGELLFVATADCGTGLWISTECFKAKMEGKSTEQPGQTEKLYGFNTFRLFRYFRLFRILSFASVAKPYGWQQKTHCPQLTILRAALCSALAEVF